MALSKRQRSLKAWGAQKWKTKSGKKSSVTGERYLPSAAIKSMSARDYASTTRAKRKAKRSGKQFSKQPKRIAAMTRRFRRFS
tara:strand:- start:232 stop:480 length:249 start_codon:yes stop_codon:yes gene_type:complete